MNHPRVFCAVLVLMLVGLAANGAQAADMGAYKRLESDLDTARNAEAHVFAPKSWKKAMEAYTKAKKAVAEGKKQKDLDEHVGEAAEYVANAMKATDVGKLSLQEYLEPREKAKSAGAPARVPELYAVAEKKFVEATGKVEEGNVKDGIKKAGESRPLFDTAELEAIRIEILGQADKLIAQAVTDEAEKYAVTTLDKARSARSRANTVLTSDRYNRAETVADAQLSEYEARHASNIAMSVRSLNRNDQAWEKLMLGYEIQMNRVGATFGHDHLMFDEGSDAAAAQLLDDVTALQQENESLQFQLAGVMDKMSASLGRVDAQPAGDDPRTVAEQLDKELLSLIFARREMDKKLAAGQSDLAELSRQQQEVEGELAVRREKEEKFRKAKKLLNPSEGQVLFNPANDVVLRLHGLSFGVGQSEIQDNHVTLLDKVEQIVAMYPGHLLVIEGHTDLTGDPQANVTLSEKRAYAVMQYLRESMGIRADAVRAIGYGADRPVSSNKTDEGRAKNRRIDIIVMQ